MLLLLLQIPQVLAEWTGLTNPASPLTHGSASVYDFGTPVAGPVGAVFTVCWQHEADAGFQVLLDSAAEMTGPEPAAFLCTLGLSCSLDLVGHNLVATNAIVVLADGNQTGIYDQGWVVHVCISKL